MLVGVTTVGVSWNRLRRRLRGSNRGGLLNGFSGHFDDSFYFCGSGRFRRRNGRNRLVCIPRTAQSDRGADRRDHSQRREDDSNDRHGPALPLAESENTEHDRHEPDEQSKNRNEPDQESDDADYQGRDREPLELLPD
ncbi:hypothetical protein ACFPRL_09610 [Pseudoclavibacter helvolus]